jgi:hypothetical protein
MPALIVTELRRPHFPPERNWLDAHISLFHAMPMRVCDVVLGFGLVFQCCDVGIDGFIKQGLPFGIELLGLLGELHPLQLGHLEGELVG